MQRLSRRNIMQRIRWAIHFTLPRAQTFIVDTIASSRVVCTRQVVYYSDYAESLLVSMWVGWTNTYMYTITGSSAQVAGYVYLQTVDFGRNMTLTACAAHMWSYNINISSTPMHKHEVVNDLEKSWINSSKHNTSPGTIHIYYMQTNIECNIHTSYCI